MRKVAPEMYAALENAWKAWINIPDGGNADDLREAMSGIETAIKHARGEL